MLANPKPFRTFLPAICVLAALAGLPQPARADGEIVKSTIGLAELVEKSAVIVTATVESAKTNWASRMAYGKDQKYVQSFEFKVKVDGWVKGSPFPAADKPVLIGYKGDTPPGKWALVEEAYRTRFSPHGAKAGDRVILFVEADDAEQWALAGSSALHKVREKEVEAISVLPEVKRQVAQTAFPAPVKSRSAPPRSK